MTSKITLSRRAFGLVLGGGLAAAALPAAALNTDQAKALIDKAVADINAVINSGKSESAMLPDFEKLFARYADVPTIARSALGVAAKSASAAQMKAFNKAFQVYISRKYGRRFREFIGGRIEVQEAHPLKSYFEVTSIAYLKGESPFEVRWHVSDRSGQILFFNLIIDGVNVLAAERQEVGTMLERRGGNLDRMIQDLRQAG